MDKDLKNGFDGFMKEFKNIPSENMIDELEELGVTFVHVECTKFHHEEEQSEINTQIQESDIS